MSSRLRDQVLGKGLTEEPEESPSNSSESSDNESSSSKGYVALSRVRLAKEISNSSASLRLPLASEHWRNLDFVQMLQDWFTGIWISLVHYRIVARDSSSQKLSSHRDHGDVMLFYFEFFWKGL